MIEITAIDTRSLGDRAYLVTDGSVALVIDPQRDFDRVTELAAARGVPITDVFETHIHNDYVTADTRSPCHRRRLPRERRRSGDVRADSGRRW